MKANCWYGKHDVRVENVPDPQIVNPRDAIVKITATAICGSDLHLYDGYIPTMERGDILGHEFMGEVMEVGRAITNLKVGDRVVVPFPIACGNCFFCKKELYSLCENSNPNAWMAEKMWGHSPCGIFGYSHLVGGYAGGQAEYVRVPYADVGPIKIENGLPDEKVLFLSDILPTGYMAAENCDIQPGDTVAVWGCGPVGQFAIASAFLLGAERVIAIDRFPERLAMAAANSGAEPLNYEEVRSIRSTQRDHRRARPGCLYRRGWDGSTRYWTRRSVRSREAGRHDGNRSPARVSRSHHGVPERRDSLRPRRLRRIHRQDADWISDESRTHAQDRANPRPPLSATTARAHRERRYRPELRHYPSHAARGCSRGVPDVQGQD